MIRGTICLLSAPMFLAACAPTAQQAQADIAASRAEMSDAEKLAEALRSANAAFSNDDVPLLRTGLAAIRASGGRALDEAAQSELDSWSAKAPDPSIPLRGRTLGPGYRAGVLAAGVNAEIAQTFLAGKSASIALTSTKGEKLDLRVLDGSAKPVCRNQASPMSCRWIPVFTQRHRIVLSNPGPKPVRYYLVID